MSILERRKSYGRRDEDYRTVHRWRWIVLWVWVVVFTIFTGNQWRDQHNTIVQGQQAHDALCAINARNIERVKDSRNFLRLHPNGVSGITSKVILASIKADESTIKTISTKINCK